MMHGEPAGRTAVPVLGVDGCPGGWVGALVTGQQVAWLHLQDMDAVVDVDAAAVGIDMPIGLPDVGRRECDRAAKQALGYPRAHSVFWTPVRRVLEAGSHPEAVRLSRAADAKGLSIQAFHLLPKIRQVDLAVNAELQQRVVEVHPELSFLRMSGRDLGPKKNPAGRDARLQVLRTWLPGVDLAGRPRAARADDALDALACAWTAARWHAGTAEVLPHGPPRDGHGLRMEIVA